MPVDSRDEQAGSPVEEGGTDGSFRATRTWLCDWADRYFVKNKLTENGGEQYPYGDGEGGTDAYCQSVSITPFENATTVDPLTGLCVYDKAKVVAQYGFRNASVIQPNPENPQELFSETWEPTIELMALDHRMFRWNQPYYIPKTYDASGQVTAWQSQYALTAEQAPSRQMHGAVYTYERHNLSQVPTSLQDLEGTINQFSIVTKTFGRTLPAESCLLLPTPIDVAWFVVGGWLVKKVRTTLRIHFRNIPSWNKFWRPDLYDGSDPDTAWDTIKDSTGAVVQIYPVKDWAALWA